MHILIKTCNSSLLNSSCYEDLFKFEFYSLGCYMNYGLYSMLVRIDISLKCSLVGINISNNNVIYKALFCGFVFTKN